MRSLQRAATSSRALMSGWLLVFAIGIVLELLGHPVLIVLALFLIVLGIMLARYAARHFHGTHTHFGDAAIDLFAIGALLIANVLHPMVDGFSAYETFAQSAVAGTLFLISIMFHEILRQWALIEAVRTHVKRPVLLITSTALVGIVGGVGIGFLGTDITQQHEYIADLATMFAYAFIIGEFYFADHGHGGKKSKWFVVLGLAVGALLTFFLRGH